jgi:hypothetical protein
VDWFARCHTGQPTDLFSHRSLPVYRPYRDFEEREEQDEQAD